MKVETLAQGLLDGLGELGTPAAIAEHLDELGIKGHCRQAHACAVAEYLLKGIGPSYSISLGHDLGSVLHANNFPVTVVVPTVVREFIREFDAGKHPALIA